MFKFWKFYNSKNKFGIMIKISTKKNVDLVNDI